MKDLAAAIIFAAAVFAAVRLIVTAIQAGSGMDPAARTRHDIWTLVYRPTAWALGGLLALYTIALLLVGRL